MDEEEVYDDYDDENDDVSTDDDYIAEDSGGDDGSVYGGDDGSVSPQYDFNFVTDEPQSVPLFEPGTEFDYNFVDGRQGYLGDSPDDLRAADMAGSNGTAMLRAPLGLDEENAYAEEPAPPVAPQPSRLPALIGPNNPVWQAVDDLPSMIGNDPRVQAAAAGGLEAARDTAQIVHDLPTAAANAGQIVTTGINRAGAAGLDLLGVPPDAPGRLRADDPHMQYPPPPTYTRIFGENDPQQAEQLGVPYQPREGWLGQLSSPAAPSAEIPVQGPPVPLGSLPAQVRPPSDSIATADEPYWNASQLPPVTQRGAESPPPDPTPQNRPSEPSVRPPSPSVPVTDEPYWNASRPGAQAAPSVRPPAVSVQNDPYWNASKPPGYQPSDPARRPGSTFVAPAAGQKGVVLEMVQGPQGAEPNRFLALPISSDGSKVQQVGDIPGVVDWRHRDGKLEVLDSQGRVLRDWSLLAGEREKAPAPSKGEQGKPLVRDDWAREDHEARASERSKAPIETEKKSDDKDRKPSGQQLREHYNYQDWVDSMGGGN